MPKSSKLLSYKKCRRCRHDRAKCLPEGRSWPGTRCDRCVRFDYECSASYTKTEEASIAGDDLASKALTTSTTLKETTLHKLENHDSFCQLRDEYDKSYTRKSLSMSNDVTEMHIRTQVKDLERSLWREAALYAADGLSGNADKILSRLCGAHDLITSKNYVEDFILPSFDENFPSRSVGCTSHDHPAIKMMDSLIISLHQGGNLWVAIKLQECMLKDCYRGIDEECKVIMIKSLFALYDHFIISVQKLDLHRKRDNLLAHHVILRRIIRLRVSTTISQGLRRYSMENVSNEMSTASWMLYIAAEEDQSDAICTILESEPTSINAQDHVDWTPLHIAIHENSWSAAQMLIKSGANVNSTGDGARRPLHMVCRNSGMERLSIARNLLRHGAEIDAQDTHDCSALHEAVQCGDVDLIRLLLQRGANRNLLDKAGETPRGKANDQQWYFPGIPALMDSIE